MNIVVEASIGVGKTTLLKKLTTLLQETFKIEVSSTPEPIKEWVETPSGNLLALFGSEPQKYAFLTQVLIMATMNYQRQIPPDSKVRIFERSIDSAKNIFQKTLEEKQHLNGLEVYTLEILHKTLQKSKPRTDFIIYLKVF